MRLCRALLIAACAVPLSCGIASAQTAPRDPFGSPPPAQQGPDPFGAPPPRQTGPDPFAGPPAGMGGMGGGFGPPPPQQQQAPPCVAEFFKLRDDAQKRGQALQIASQKKAPPKEACRLFNAFVAAQDKMLKYAVAHKTACGVPDEVIKQIREGHTKTSEIRTRVCQMAEAPPRPAGPSLSDTLTAPIPDAKNVRPGSGTFDTLTGNALSK